MNRYSLYFFTVLLSFLFACKAEHNDQRSSTQKEAESVKSGTVYFVRHADRDSKEDQLSEAGHKRAQDLVELMKDRNIDYIFSSNYNRTKQTVNPLCKAINVEYEMYDAGNQEALREKILLHAVKNNNVLVVGHSNTIPEIIKLCNPTLPEIKINENEFDKIFTLNMFPRMSFSTHSYEDFAESIK